MLKEGNYLAKQFFVQKRNKSDTAKFPQLIIEQLVIIKRFLFKCNRNNLHLFVCQEHGTTYPLHILLAEFLFTVICD